jgi:(2R)-sulfolactate sulfo-lyase subunit alpha
MKHGALMHGADDDVAVVVQDVSSGTEVRAVTLDGADRGSVTAVEDIPLGHKIAMRDISEGETVTKYGRSIGKASANIKKGAHVHTQNIKTVRWS